MFFRKLRRLVWETPIERLETSLFRKLRKVYKDDQALNDIVKALMIQVEFEVARGEKPSEDVMFALLRKYEKVFKEEAIARQVLVVALRSGILLENPRHMLTLLGEISQEILSGMPPMIPSANLQVAREVQRVLESLGKGLRDLDDRYPTAVGVLRGRPRLLQSVVVTRYVAPKASACACSELVYRADLMGIQMSVLWPVIAKTGSESVYNLVHLMRLGLVNTELARGFTIEPHVVVVKPVAELAMDLAAWHENGDELPIIEFIARRTPGSRLLEMR